MTLASEVFCYYFIDEKNEVCWIWSGSAFQHPIPSPTAFSFSHSICNIWIIPFTSQAPSAPNLRITALADGPYYLLQVFVQLPPFSGIPERKNGTPKACCPVLFFLKALISMGRALTSHLSTHSLARGGVRSCQEPMAGRVQPWQVPIREWMRLMHV